MHCFCYEFFQYVYSNGSVQGYKQKAMLTVLAVCYRFWDAHDIKEATLISLAVNGSWHYEHTPSE